MRKAKRKAGKAAAQPAPPPVPILIIERGTIDWDKPIPGQAWWSKEAGAPEGTMRLTFVCPGGCGDIGGCRCAPNKPPENPSWEWNGDREKPTLKPSILSTACGWHGYLTNGQFQVLAGAKNQCRGRRN